MKFKKLSLFEKLYLVLIFGFLILICSNIRFLIPSFDGAMNLVIAKNLALYNKYFSFYFNSAFPFPIQTRFFLQVPSALFIKIFGLSNFSVLLTSAISTFTYIFLSFKLCNKLQINKLFSFNIFIIPFLIFTPLLLNTGLLGFGELITYCFIIIAILVWHKTLIKQNFSILNYLLIGFLFGCAFITKTVSIIIIPSFLVAILFSFFFKKQKILKNLLLIPLLIFATSAITYSGYEMFRFKISKKSSYKSLVDLQQDEVLRQAGLKKSDHWSFISKSKYDLKENNKNAFLDKYVFKYVKKFFHHLSITAYLLEINVFLLLIFLFLPSLLILYLIFKRKLNTNNATIIIFIASIAVSYFMWWLVLSPTIKMDKIGFVRRIVPAFTFNFIIISILLNYFLKKISKKNIAFATVLLLPCLFLFLGNVDDFAILFNNEHKNFVNNEFNKVLNKDDKPKDIYVMGYNHSPQFLLFSKYKFKNILKYSINDILNKENQYLLLDSYSISSESFRPILNSINYTVEAIQPNLGVLIKILPLEENNSFIKLPEQETFAKSCLNKNDIFYYENKSGFYNQIDENNKNEINVNWTSKIVNVELEKGRYNSLAIEYYIPKTMLLSKKMKYKTLSVYLNGKFILDLPIKHNTNFHNIFLEKSYCNNAENNIVTLKINSKVLNPKARFLGINLTKICLQNINEPKFIRNKNLFVANHKKLLIASAGVNYFGKIWIKAANQTHYCNILVNDVELETFMDEKNVLKSNLPEKFYKEKFLTFKLKDNFNQRVSTPYKIKTPKIAKEKK